MKCPFKKKIKTTKGIKHAYQYPYDITETFFGDCSLNECMAYHKGNKSCLMLTVKQEVE